MELSSALESAVVRNAERLADAVATVLRELFPQSRRGDILWRAAFLAEFGAVVQIGYWEKHGINAHVAAGLPGYAEAGQMLQQRCRRGPKAFANVEETPLCDQTVKFMVENIAWAGPTIMEAEVVLADIDEEQFVDRLAEFVWRNREELVEIQESFSGAGTRHDS